MQYIHDNYVTRGVFSDDVVLKCNAVGVADESRFFSITDYPRNNYSEWTSFLSAALDLTKSVRLTVGGDWSADRYTNDYIDPINNVAVGNYNIYCHVCNSAYDTRAVYARENLDLVLTAQAGADVRNANRDTNIKIRTEASARWNKENFSFTPPDVVATAIGIDANSDLTVLSDLVGTIEADAEFYSHGYSTTIGTTTTYYNTTSDQAADAIGLRSGNDMELKRNFNATITCTATLDAAAYATLIASDNTADAVGLRAGGDLTAVNGEWNGSITAVTTGNSLSALVADLVDIGKKDASDLSDNSFSAYGIQAEGTIAISHLANGTITVETSHNSLEIEGVNVALEVTGNALDAIGIKGGTVKLDRVDRDFRIDASSTDNTFAATETATDKKDKSSFFFNDNSAGAIGIEADNLELGSFDGNITVAVRNNSLASAEHFQLYVYPASANWVYRLVRAQGISVSGNLIAKDTLRGTITVKADRLADMGFTAANGISAGNIAVAGRLDTDITIGTKVTPADLIKAFNGDVILTENLKTVIGIKATVIAADAISGTIRTVDNPDAQNPDSSYGGAGIYAGKVLTVSSAGSDAFDFIGKIEGFYEGFATTALLNLRVSGSIDTTTPYISSQKGPGNAIEAEYRVNGANNNDRVELADGAKIIGNIELGSGEKNSLIINSGASVEGKLLATNGNMNIRFDLDDTVQPEAIVKTDKGGWNDSDWTSPDISLTSDVTIRINLNRAKDGETYTLFEYETDVNAAGLEYWNYKEITFLYQGVAQKVRTDGSGTATVSFDNGIISATLAYAAKKVTVTVTNPVALPDFEFTSFASQRLDAVAAPGEVSLLWGDVCTSENKADAITAALYDTYEVEYRIKEAGSSSFGKSIVVTVGKDALLQTGDDAWQHGVTLRGIDAGETIEWRVRGTTNNGETISKWSSDGASYQTFSPYTAPIAAAPTMSDRILPRAVNPNNASGGNNSATLRFQWLAATGEAEIANYTVRYLQADKQLSSVSWADDNLTPMSDVSATTVDGDEITLPLLVKTTTAPEIFASNLPDHAYVYWQVRATDVNGNSSAWLDGETFQVWIEDGAAPQWIKANGPAVVQYDRIAPYYDAAAGDDALSFDVKFSWDNYALDNASGSGVKSYVFSYKLRDDSWEDNTKVTEVTIPDVTASDANTIGIHDLKSGTYDFRVQAVDWAGNRSEAIESSATIGDSIAPDWSNSSISVMRTFTTNETDGVECTVSVSWGDATDQMGSADLNSFAGSIKKYEFAWAGGVETFSHGDNYAAPATSITIGSGYDYATYSCRVKAYDFAGNTITTYGYFYYGDDIAPTLSDPHVAVDIVYDTTDETHQKYTATVSWDPAQDLDPLGKDGKGSGVHYYYVEYVKLESANDAHGKDEWAAWAAADALKADDEEKTIKSSGPLAPAADDGRNSYTLPMLEGHYAWRVYAVDYFGNGNGEAEKRIGSCYYGTTVLGDIIAPSWATTATVSKDVVYGEDETGAITVEATFTWDPAENVGGAGVKEYVFQYLRPGETEWQSVTVDGCSRTMTELFSDACQYQVFAVDYAGNVSDPLLAQVPFISVGLLGPTNRNVSVTAVFGDDSVTKEYSPDGETWKAYSKGVTMTDNGILYFRGKDAMGNVIEEASIPITNIDRIAPEKPVVVPPATTDPTQQDVTVAATFSDDSVTHEYSLDGKTWKAYPEEDGVVMTANGTVYFRGRDEAGNISEVTEYVVSNIDRIPPAKPTASADITDPTQQDVTVAATFSEDSVTKEYSLDGETWKAYPEDGVEMEENGTVYFRSRDEVGNISDVTEYVVSNIDRIPPAKPTVSDVVAAGPNSVTVTVVFSDDSVVKEYSLDGETWEAYPESGLGVIADSTVYFHGIDAAGNISDVTECVVDPIESPEAPTASADITDLTNQNVIVTAEFGDDSVTKEYSLDGETWKAYPEDDGVEMTANGTVYFRGIDAVGNVSEVTGYDVDNIDKTPPPAPVASADITAKTGRIVTVTAVFDDDCEERQYSFNRTLWMDYTDGVQMLSNGSVYFRGTDSVGNISDITRYTVSNIDPSYFLVDSTVSETLGYDKNYSDKFSPELIASGLYKFSGSFGKLNGTLTVKTGSTTVASATITKGVLKFKVGSANMYLDRTKAYNFTFSNSDKGKSKSAYSFSLTTQKVFDSPDSSIADNWGDLKTNGAASTRYGDLGTFTAGGVFAPGAMAANDDLTLIADGWVGFGDAVDYRAFTLESAAKLSFTVTTTDAVKFSVFSLVKTTTKGKTTYSLKSLQSKTLAANTSASTAGLLLKKGTYYLAVQSTNAAKGGDAYYSLALRDTSEFYTEVSTDDNAWATAPTVEKNGSFGGWVGFSDATDYREFTGVAATGGLYSFKLTGASNKVKLTVYEVQTTKVKGKTTTSLKALKSVTATSSASTGNLALAGSKRYIVAVTAVDAATGKNSNYTLATSEVGIFTGTGNNTFAKATKLAAETELTGMLSKVSGGDTVDFYDLAAVKNQALNLEMTSGTLKLTFCDKSGKAIKVASVTMADTSVKKNISTLTLTNGNAVTDSIAFMASASNLRYLKIEATAGGVNAYNLAVPAVA